ncbi:cysteine--tRNA ligase [Spirulina major]|uniref:cysteine--tRNA ligase n=1 Tax=Spirulina major TaxID=270636 RepID=UPI0009354A3D|nr:cysteine--tRNA ligase [Spirulina major]
MTLTLYNTQTRSETLFTPLEPGVVTFYCCGVTVYDACHLGHGRSYIVWDVLRRYLQWRGYQVRYVQNFTDIDDKILQRAEQDGVTMEAVSDRYIAEYFQDMDRLNILRADAYPRVTEHIPQICDLIATLIDRGLAYAAGGDVYYSVEHFPSYGKLSGRKLADLQAGAGGRVSTDEPGKKRHPFDFALWKAAKPGEPSWESPWGAGRPGWHIECSAMVKSILSDTIDIHTGGSDLIFPHHENEIAQSEGATSQPLAHYWLHNGMVKIGGDKMSKSLQNFVTIQNFLERYPDPMVLRLFVLQAQYRKPLDFTEEAIASAENAWHTLKDGLRFGLEYGDRLGWHQPDRRETDYTRRFRSVMDQDINTPNGLAVLFELAKELRRVKNILVHEGEMPSNTGDLEAQWRTLVELAGVLGLDATLNDGEPAEVSGLSDGEIDGWIAQRTAARNAKNFAESDRIRDHLKAQGIVLVDTPTGTTWHREA